LAPLTADVTVPQPDAPPSRTSTLLLLDANRDAAVLALLALVGGALSIGAPFPIAAVLLLVGAVLAVVSPVAAAAAVAAATPFVFHPVHLRGGAFSLLELALLVGGFGVAVRFAWTARSGGLASSLRAIVGNPATTIAAVLLVLLGVFSLVTIADPRHLTESIRELRVVIVEPVAALVLTRWVLRHNGARFLLLGLLCAGIAVSLWACLQVVTGHGEVIGNGVARATGPYPHPNNLALYLERVGLVAAALSLSDAGHRKLFLPVTVVIAAGLAATLSRGAVLAVIAGGALLLAVLRPARGWRWFGLAAALTVVVFAIAAGDRLVSNGTGGVTSSRELIWRSSLRMAADHPIFGVGLDQFLYQYAPRYVRPAGWPERYTSHPHNIVLDVWLSLGVAGLALFAAIAVIYVRSVLRLRRLGVRTEQTRLALAGAALLAGGVAHGLVDNGFFLPDLAVLTWIAFALLEPRPSDSSTVPVNTT
jgi:O-antigen ligase